MIIQGAWNASGIKQTKTLPLWSGNWIDGRQNTQKNRQDRQVNNKQTKRLKSVSVSLEHNNREQT